MKINIKTEYEIEWMIHESDLMKIDLILQNSFYSKNEAIAIENGYYILKLNLDQLMYILDYFLKKEV